MSQEKGNSATISQQDADKLLGDRSEPSSPETIRVKPQWREKAKKRPAAQRKEPTGKIEFSVPKDPDQVTQASQIIKKIIVEDFPSWKVREIRAVFTDGGIFQQQEVEDEQKI